MRQTYLTRQDTDVGVGVFDSIAWALEKIGVVDSKEYNTAMLYGNEDDPNRIDFYTQAEPKITDKPAFVWNGEERD